MNLPSNRVLTLLLVAVFALGATGCGSDDEQTTTAEDTAAQQAAASEKADAAKEEAAQKKQAAMEKAEAVKKGKSTKIKVGDVSPWGGILQNGKGLTIYLFTKEDSSKSECYGDCAKAWPPVLTEADPTAGSGVSESKLGTTKRRDGSLQVTYNDHPLYYYVDEDEPNEVLCQAVSEFGGIWYVVDKKGDAITS